ncbi:MAG: CDP-diglyceride synthetase [Halonotius sp. J07HN6]|nr:MAG: CDP-diglyceride synthetase [Halonotius sp. J07HN6]
MWLPLVVTAVWAMLPAYVPNNAAAIGGGGRAIDGGRRWGDRRLLGDGKTWRGTAIGTLAGVGLAAVLNLVAAQVSSVGGVTVPPFPPGAAVGLAAGAMAGDIAASFLKRRSGRKRGASFPVLDQLDFVAGALVAVYLLAPGWAVATFTPSVVAVVVVVTPLLHLATNVIGYQLGVKAEPW